jgi:hypothetical protein
LYLKENQKTLSARKATITRPLGHSSPDPVPGIPKAGTENQPTGDDSNKISAIDEFPNYRIN